MNQTDRVLNHMEKVGPITGKEAMDLYGIQRLGARIWELKRAGVDIRSTMVEGKNRFGDTVHFKQYFIWRRS